MGRRPIERLSGVTVRGLILDRIEELLGRDEDRTPLDLLSGRALEALGRIIEADGRPVPGSKLCHQRAAGIFTAAGDWSTPGCAASVVSEIRLRLGQGSVLTVRGHGYCLGVLPEGLL